MSDGMMESIRCATCNTEIPASTGRYRTKDGDVCVGCVAEHVALRMENSALLYHLRNICEVTQGALTEAEAQADARVSAARKESSQ